MSERLKIALVDFAIFVPLQISLWSAYKAFTFAIKIIEANPHHFWG